MQLKKGGVLLKKKKVIQNTQWSMYYFKTRKVMSLLTLSTHISLPVIVNVPLRGHSRGQEREVKEYRGGGVKGAI